MSYSIKNAFFISAALVLSALFSAATAAAAAPAASTFQTPSLPDPFEVQGYLSAKYVSRSTRVAGQTIRDEDAYSDLRIDLTQPRSNAYEFHFFGTLRDDLTRTANKTDTTYLADIGDTYQQRAHGYLYEAHLDFNNPFWNVSQLRLGRQDGTRDEPVFFDGVALDVNAFSHVNVTAYGGSAVHLYELDEKPGSSTLGGVGVDVAPASWTLMSVDYLYTADTISSGTSAKVYDHLAAFRVSQRFSQYVKAAAKVRSVNDETADAKVSMTGTLPDAGFEVYAALFRQFRTQNELATDLSSFYEVIGQSAAYRSTDVKVREIFGPRLAVDIGYYERMLLRPQDLEGVFNHSYRRTYGVLTVSDVPFKGLSAAFTGEQWSAGDRTMDTTGLDLGYAFTQGRRAPKINVGTYYSLYKYDYYVLLGERTNVRTYYAKLELPFGRHFAISGGYEFERGVEDYNTARAGVRYDF